MTCRAGRPHQLAALGSLPRSESSKSGPRRRKPELLASVRNETAYFSIEMLPARNGDCLWIEFGERKNPTRLLIDCGVEAAYPSLRHRIDQLPEVATPV